MNDTKKPSAQGLRIIELCHLHPNSTAPELAKLMGLPEIETMVIITTQRDNRNLKSVNRGHYMATPKGREIIGAQEPKAELKKFEYETLQAVEMVSYRPGAWDASAIKRRGLAC